VAVPLGAFLLNERGRPVSVRSLNWLFESLRERVHTQLPLSPHWLRHEFATTYLQEGGDIRDLQALLGHSSLTTTQVYTHFSLARQRTTVDRLAATLTK